MNQRKDLIAQTMAHWCPRCGAQAGERCRKKNGKTSPPHSERVMVHRRLQNGPDSNTVES